MLESSKFLQQSPVKINKKGVDWQNFPPSETGYTYDNFLSDCYEFMVDAFEETNNYFTAPKDVLFSEDNKDFVVYGIDNGLLWIVPLNDTGFVYVEVVNGQTRESLLETYVDEYLSSQGLSSIEKSEQAEGILSEIKTRYLNSMVRCMTDLHYYLTEGDHPRPIGVCSTLDVSFEGKDGLLVPVFPIALSSFVLMVSSAKLKVLNLYSNPSTFYNANKGYYEKGLNNVTVNGTGSVIFLEGVRRIE